MEPGKFDLPLPAISVFAGSDLCALLQDHSVRCFSPITYAVTRQRKFDAASVGVNATE